MCDKVIEIDDMLKFCLSEKFGNKLKQLLQNIPMIWSCKFFENILFHSDNVKCYFKKKGTIQFR